MNGKSGTRNTPSLFNVGFQSSFFWDGRRDSLETQALDPVTNPIEHGLRDVGEVLNIVRADTHLASDVAHAFGATANEISASMLASALASYERTLVAGNSAFDRYRYGHDAQAISDSAKRGLSLFEGRAGCATCHVIGADYALFSDGKFHSVGIVEKSLRANLGQTATAVVRLRASALDHAILEKPEYAALGRFVVTHKPEDVGAYRTPSLRNVVLTAPYMHDGSRATLAEALDEEIYYRGTELGRPLILTPQEKADLMAFMEALTSSAETRTSLSGRSGQ
jgi:cytochrome c peroxidase